MIDFNPIHDEAFIRNPLPRLKQAWAERPVVRHDNLCTTYSVFSYADVRRIFSEPEVFGSEIPAEARKQALGKALDNLIATDPPRHTRLRALANRGFLPGVIRRYQPRTEEVVRERMDYLLDQGEVDIVTDFSAQITISMISAILGLPGEDWPRIRKWTTDIINNTMVDLWLRAEDPERLALTRRVTDELAAYFSDYIRERRQRKIENDVISDLMNADIDGDRLSNEELESTAMLLLLAGNETTTNLITNFVRCMTWFPEQAQLLRQRPELAPAAVEETLRFCPSLRGTARRVRRDTEVHGMRLGPGDNIFGWITTANRDPAQFERPDEFDLTRQNNRHISFAAGPHVCLGAPLARLETRLAVEQLMQRTKTIELVGEARIGPNAILDNILSQRVRVAPA